jgi:mono/diheme cytochrome c family protein
MSQDSKRIIAVVAGVLAVFGLAIVAGSVLVRGHGTHTLPYRQAMADTQPDPTIFPTVKGKVKGGLDLTQMFASTPQALSSGKQLFGTYCAACHGTGGKGDGVAASALHPAPRDFTSPRGWTRGYTIADIYVTLSEGVKGTSMGAFDMIKPADRFAVAHYVQSLGKFDHHDEPPDEIARLKTKYHFSEGIQEPNKVAVPVVMKHMEAEYATPPAIQSPPGSDTSIGADLCRRLVVDPVAAAQVLSRIPDWRTNLDVFAHAAMADTPRNGFRAAVATLSLEQWKAFHAELVALTTAPAPGAG